jgi:DNA-binding NarL/FixJ family response regulator
MPIRVAIVDDHALIRAGYRHILTREPDLQVVAEGGSGEEALTIARDLKPDVMLLDVGMPTLGGIEVTQRLTRARSPVRIVIVTMHGDGPLPKLLIEAGATAFLTKGADGAELVTAVRQAARGQHYISHAIAQRMALATSLGEGSPLDRLSPREFEIALMLGRGQRASAIGERLAISDKTVATHKSRIYEKLEVHSEAELTLLLVRHGLLPG